MTRGRDEADGRRWVDGAGVSPARRPARMLGRAAEGKEKPTMGAKPWRWVVALDGGTTNTRARLLHDGQVEATARRAVGVRDAVVGSSAPPLAVAVRDAIREVLARAGGVRPDAIVASGMLSSDVGL
ncbi:MAG: hypothetical protein K2X91_07445, partial [Thermoleophilia bacterium]|nr:hypothetical protein [Thermoleophilia bacterium]